MNEQEKLIAFESIAREVTRQYPAECGTVTAETVAAIQGWTESPEQLTLCEEVIREMLRADNLLQSSQSAAELIHRTERAAL